MIKTACGDKKAQNDTAVIDPSFENSIFMNSNFYEFNWRIVPSNRNFNCLGNSTDFFFLPT